MNISRKKLYQIILEEYAIEEGILDEELSAEKKDELIAWIRGEGPRPKWATDRSGTSGQGKAVQSPMDPDVDRAADTMPFPADDIPSDDAPERDVSGFQDRAGPPLEDQLMDLIQGLPPEEVSELFQTVFAKIPGVEMGPADEEPETLYSPGAEGRPQAGFRLEELKALILEVLAEGHYHDMGGEGEMYNVLDPHGFDKMSDSELIDMMHRDGAEEMIVLDGDGDLVNREEVVAALKDV
jgi:hypothetical protein